MQDVQEQKFITTPGLRDRKRVETHARIQSAAMRLFLDQGFEATTLDQIATSAGVSRRSLFHYFGSKEEIVFSTKAGLGPLLVRAVAARPSDEPPMRMAENALMALAADFQGPEPRALARLIHGTPALRAGDHAKYEGLERTLAQALAEQSGRQVEDAEIQAVAVTAIGVLRLSTERWLASDDGRGPEAWGQEAFAALRRAARA